jgi:hypothetical protein
LRKSYLVKERYNLETILDTYKRYYGVKKFEENTARLAWLPVVVGMVTAGTTRGRTSVGWGKGDAAICRSRCMT